jgi:hypothetical protein
VAETLDAPDDDDAVYLAVGSVVEDVRPVNQGDVYRGITLPGFPANDHDIVILTTHPCSLRAGAVLKQRLQAAPVRRAKHISPADWAASFQRHMPLPGLLQNKAYMATLTESSIVTPSQLAGADRIAALSEDGILLLQQRLVWAMTHAVIRLDTLAEYSAPAFAEIELLEEWNDALCADDEADRPKRLAAIAEEFETYIRTSSVQADLAQERKRGDARRRARNELGRRVDALDSDEGSERVASSG